MLGVELISDHQEKHMPSMTSPAQPLPQSRSAAAFATAHGALLPARRMPLTGRGSAAAGAPEAPNAEDAALLGRAEARGRTPLSVPREGAPAPAEPVLPWRAGQRALDATGLGRVAQQRALTSGVVLLSPAIVVGAGVAGALAGAALPASFAFIVCSDAPSGKFPLKMLPLALPLSVVATAVGAVPMALYGAGMGLVTGGRGVVQTLRRCP
jgi:hypothetical protein